MKAEININDIEEIMFWNISGNSGWQVKYIDGNLDTISSPESDPAFQRFIQTHIPTVTNLTKSQGDGEVITWHLENVRDSRIVNGSVYQFKVTKRYLTIVEGNRTLVDDISFTSMTLPQKPDHKQQLEICEDIRKLESARNPGKVVKVSFHSVLS